MNSLPTTNTLYTNILANLKSNLGITATLLKKIFLIPFAIVWAGILKLWYLLLGQIQNNIWVDTCDNATLLRFGYVILNSLPDPAIAGQYTCTVTGITGGTIPANTLFIANPTSTSPSQLFILPTSYTLSGSTGSIVITAITGGIIAQLNIGDTLNATAPITNVNSLITVTAITIAPIDAETLQLYRQKIIIKIQTPAGSWSATDYRINGILIAGVRQIYAYTDLSTSNEVDVWIEGTTYGSSPSGTVITNVTNAINLLYPLGVHLTNYAASTINIIAVTITMGTFPAFTTTQMTAITNAIVAFINTVRPFIASCDAIQGRNDILSASNLYPIISGAVPGYGYASATFTVDSILETTYQADLGRIPFCNSVIFV